ncbi:hypothetical protein OHD62_05550 [Mesorhizobium sp. YC-39]|uniref:hypothetical protein n=1 Tax=unclassified Mesorhizobium TaxID=325217 RepID=UPI0021E6F317|nr:MULTISPECIES: hypothetical protein [unclassified Mesorhizobium]MCV3205768.1 hypothetical protein [Mesorhizobium sp. YC-2]MCV3227833.1 hypothetical protein [Mesorhizobium sp. YC-39]
MSSAVLALRVDFVTFSSSLTLQFVQGKPVRSYLPYILGAALGLLVAFILSAILGVGGIPQLLLFGLFPAIGGTVCERIVGRN